MKACNYPIRKVRCGRALMLAPSWGAALRLVAGALVVALPLRVLAAGEQQFDTPEAAVSALETAAKNRDTNAVRTIFGPAGRDLVSPDAVQATQEFELFQKRLSEKTELVRRSEATCVLQLGTEAWPFPIPLVKVDAYPATLGRHRYGRGPEDQRAPEKGTIAIADTIRNGRLPIMIKKPARIGQAFSYCNHYRSAALTI